MSDDRTRHGSWKKNKNQSSMSIRQKTMEYEINQASSIVRRREHVTWNVAVIEVKILTFPTYVCQSYRCSCSKLNKATWLLRNYPFFNTRKLKKEIDSGSVLAFAFIFRQLAATWRFIDERLRNANLPAAC
jgi:hypothetical protein